MVPDASRCSSSSPLAALRPIASDRPALDRFRDSLAPSTTSSPCTPAAHPRPARRRRSPSIALRCRLRGRSACRSSAWIRDAGDARATRSVRLTAREPDWPYAWHALAAGRDPPGRVAAGRPAGARQPQSARVARAGAGQHERRAVAADPAYSPAALTLAALALGLRDTAFFAGARDALRRADAAQPACPARSAAGPWPARARGRRARTAPPPRSRRPRARTPDRDGVPRAARARAHPARARRRRAATPPTSTGRPSPTIGGGRRLSRRPGADRGRLGPRPVRRVARGADRAAWLRRFWTDRDHVELRHDGERLREHYRRLLYARRHFALTDRAPILWPAGRVPQRQRGARRPRRDLRAPRRAAAPGSSPSSSGSCRTRPGATAGPTATSCSTSAPATTTPAAATSTTTGWSRACSICAARPTPPIDQLLLSRQTLSPLYGRMLNWGPYGAARRRGPRARHRPGEHRLRHDDRQLRAAVRPPAHGVRRSGRRGERERRCRSRTSCSRIGAAGDDAGSRARRA